MFKKFLIILIVLAVLAVTFVTIFSRKAPEMLVQAIERSLGKKIVIRSIHYHFPSVFELEGFEVKEVNDFAGETSFVADRIRLDVPLLSLPQKSLVIDTLEIQNAEVVIRKYHGKLIHVLSDAAKSTGPANPAQGSKTPSHSRAPDLPLEIHQFKLSGSSFKFIDYDAAEGGFVIALDQIEADIHNIELPFSDGKTVYKISARMRQGGEQKAAQVQISGRTQFKTKDTDMNVIAQGVYLPYFQPYYRQVTQAAIQSAYLDSRLDLLLEHNDLSLNAELDVSGLVFRDYEAENQLFGLRADEILSFLKDRSGRFKLQLVAQWNIADRSLQARDVIRKSIERSLKKTVIGNAGNILENALQAIGNQNTDKTKGSLEDKIKRLKEIFK